MLWSQTVDDYYPVSPRPRWGFGQPVHAAIGAVLERSRPTYERCIDDLGRNREALYAIPFANPVSPVQPFWDNIWFSCLDAAALVSLLLTHRPKRYIEIGSGHSTRFARHAVAWGSLGTEIISIDPQPRAEIDAICDRLVRSPLEDCDLTVFDCLRPGDLLFFDGSHRVFTNSDTTALFFDVLPRLPPGVLVHLHDIFLPADYPPAWNQRLYSEQYLLGAMMLCPARPFRILLPNFFCCSDERLGARVRAIFEGRPRESIPFVYNNGANIPGVSFWMETV